MIFKMPIKSFVGILDIRSKSGEQLANPIYLVRYKSYFFNKDVKFVFGSMQDGNFETEFTLNSVFDGQQFWYRMRQYEST